MNEEKNKIVIDKDKRIYSLIKYINTASGKENYLQRSTYYCWQVRLTNEARTISGTDNLRAELPKLLGDEDGRKWLTKIRDVSANQCIAELKRVLVLEAIFSNLYNFPLFAWRYFRKAIVKEKNNKPNHHVSPKRSVSGDLFSSP